MLFNDLIIAKAYNSFTDDADVGYDGLDILRYSFNGVSVTNQQAYLKYHSISDATVSKFSSRYDIGILQRIPYFKEAHCKQHKGL